MHARPKEREITMRQTSSIELKATAAVDRSSPSVEQGTVVLEVGGSSTSLSVTPSTLTVEHRTPIFEIVGVQDRRQVPPQTPRGPPPG